MISRFTADKSGATAIEYALIALFIAIVLIAGATSIGEGLQGIFGDVDAGFGEGQEG